MKKKKKIINIPSVELDKPHINRQDMEKIVNEKIKQVNDELSRGLKFIRSHPRSVTIFGSARFDERNPYYKKARELGSLIVQNGFAVVTGGGPGIMEGANRGAFESKGSSLGFVIELPTEQVINPYVNGYESFEYFFTRKVCLSFSAEAFIFMPGGFGTLDEFFEMITLVQMHKIPQIPIILFGSDFWKPLDNFIRNVLEKEHKTISVEDKNLYSITDDLEEVLRVIKEAPLRMG
jgi:uncharacterized protein (TIGR00730 family)